VLRQIARITAHNLASLPARLAMSAVVCVGIAGVVAVLVAVLAMATGLERTLASTGQDDRAIAVREGAFSEALSSLTREAVLAIETAPGVARDADGAPAVSGEVVLTVTLPRRTADLASPIVVRGVTPKGLSLRNDFQVAAGRWFEPGLHELVAGRMALEQFADLEPGSKISFHNAEWSIVGVLASGGDAHESELVGDAATLMAASTRTVYSAATVKLEHPDALAEFAAAIESDPRLAVEIKRESDFYRGQSENVSGLLFAVAYVVGSIMAVGALCGALNTMFSAVEARTVEIATLRAIGFPAMPVVVSVLVEALVLAVLGALLGVVLAWLVFEGDSFSFGGGFRQVATRLEVGPGLFVLGVTWACAIGLLGGLLPALKAARMPVADGLRVVV
jgi:putative ABC transport system permease protein